MKNEERPRSIRGSASQPRTPFFFRPFRLSDVRTSSTSAGASITPCRNFRKPANEKFSEEFDFWFRLRKSSKKSRPDGRTVGRLRLLYAERTKPNAVDLVERPFGSNVTEPFLSPPPWLWPATAGRRCRPASVAEFRISCEDRPSSSSREIRTSRRTTATSPFPSR